MNMPALQWFAGLIRKIQRIRTVDQTFQFPRLRLMSKRNHELTSVAAPGLTHQILENFCSHASTSRKLLAPLFARTACS
jgi:hypothetical protein